MNASTIFRTTAVGIALLAVWLGIGAAVPFVAAPGRAYAVLAASPAEAVAAAGGTLLDDGRLFTLARSDAPDFARRLYAAGALLVLDATEAGGCSGRPPR